MEDRARKRTSSPGPSAGTAGWIGRLLCVPIWVVVVGLLALVVARLVAFDRLRVFMLADAFTLWIFLPAYVIAVAAVCFRFRALAVAAGIVVLAHLLWVVPPLFDTIEVPAAATVAPRLRVVSANLEYSNDDLALVRELAGFDADVVMLEEVTPAWWQAIRAEGLLASYPHHVEVVRGGASGIAILSRVPLADVHTHDNDGFPMLTASLRVGDRTLHVAAVHPVAPVRVFERHQLQQDRITAIVRDLPKPRVVAGDFNATMYNEWMGELEDLGLEEAHEAVGRPFATTWPNGERLVPPLRIDHVLVDPPIVAVHVREGRGAGSDHRPVVVDLAIVDPAAPRR